MPSGRTAHRPVSDPVDMMSPVAREDVALVARTDEVRTLTDALRAAGDARPGVWLVAGDAGVGKSRLVRELSERARSAGALVLTGQCVDLGGAGLPYLPFAEALGQAAADPATAAAFDGLTALGPLLGRGGPRHDAGDDDRLPLFDAVHTALGTLGRGARPRPARDRGPALGRRLQPRPAALRRLPPAARARARGRHLPLRRPAPRPPAPPAARRAAAAARRRADRPRPVQHRRARPLPRAAARPGRPAPGGARHAPRAPTATPTSPRSSSPPP